MRVTSKLPVAVGIALCAAGAGEAAEIYRWIDADSVVHYSDEKPQDVADVSTITIETTRSTDYDPAQDPYSIQNQARRTNESWTVLEQARLDRERAQQQRDAQSQPADYAWRRSEHDGWREDRQSDTWEFTSYGYRNFGQPYDLRSGRWYHTGSPYLRPADPGAARRQQSAIEQLGLATPRAHSINSGVHRDRVQRSTELPIVIGERR